MRKAFAVAGQWFFGIVMGFYLLGWWSYEWDTEFLKAQLPGTTVFQRICFISGFIAGYIFCSVLREQVHNEQQARVAAARQRRERVVPQEELSTSNES